MASAQNPNNSVFPSQNDSWEDEEFTDEKYLDEHFSRYAANLQKTLNYFRSEVNTQELMEDDGVRTEDGYFVSLPELMRAADELEVETGEDEDFEILSYENLPGEDGDYSIQQIENGTDVVARLEAADSIRRYNRPTEHQGIEDDFEIEIAEGNQFEEEYWNHKTEAEIPEDLGDEEIEAAIPHFRVDHN